MNREVENAFLLFNKPPSPKYLIEVDDDFCCGLIRLEDDGFMICTKCGVMKPYLEHVKKYDAILNPVYSKQANFNKILNQLEATEYFPLKELDQIKLHVKNHKLLNLSVERLCQLFHQVQQQYKNNTKKNMLNYHFILSKLFIYLDRREYLPYLQTIKGEQKLKEAEIEFAKINLE